MIGLQKLDKLAFHPILFAAFPILSLYSHNIGELTLDQLIQPLTLSIIFAVLLWALINLILPDRKLSAITASILILTFFSFSPIIKVFNLAYLYILLSIAFAWFATYFFAKSKGKSRQIRLDKITILLNLISILVLAMPLFRIINVELNRLNRNTKLSTLSFQNKDQSTKKLPDIYYLVIDAYDSNQSFNDYFDFDNSDFTNFLTDKGFYVAERSKSNYPFTLASFSSFLNMTYLDDVINQIRKNDSDWTPITSILEDNQTVLYLKSRGYKYFNFGAPWYTNKNRNADFTYSYRTDNLTISPLSQQLLAQTVFDPMLSQIDCSKQESFLCVGTVNNRYSMYNYLINEVKELSQVTKQQGPKFVFLHSLLVHEPYLFTDKGDYVSEAVERSQYWRKNYVAAVIFTNSLLKGLIEDILKNSETPPIIILQADHGTYPDRFNGETAIDDWHSATEDELKEKVQILNAYYLPDNKSGILYPSITPVNTFRIVLNSYFREKLPLLPDLSFVQSQRMNLWDFFEVTNIVK